jgi:hypothetical protein
VPIETQTTRFVIDVLNIRAPRAAEQERKCARPAAFVSVLLRSANMNFIYTRLSVEGVKWG